MDGFNSNNNETSNINIQHYVDLLNRKKWFILFTTFIVSIVWLIILFYVMDVNNPELEAQALLGFDNPSNMSAVDESAGLLAIDSKIGLIKSRSFLDDVVKKLSLQLAVKSYFRQDIFSHILLNDSIARAGEYDLQVSDLDYEIYFSNPMLDIDDELISVGNFEIADSLSLQGIELKFSSGYIKKPYDVTFLVVRSRDVIDQILLKLEARAADFRRSLLSIKLLGTDYPLITDIVNTIANEFVKFNLSFKKRKTKEVLKVLEKQLSKAETEKEISEKALQGFKEKYPWVGLQQDANRVIEDLSQLETTNYGTQAIFDDTQQLVMRYLNINNEDAASLINEIIAFLNSHRIAVAPAMLTEINTLINEKAALENQYGPTHPYVIENNKKIDVLGGKVSSALNDFSKKLKSDLDQTDSKIKNSNYRLTLLPAKEQILADLDRQARVDGDIYQTILSKYNESKIADAVEVGDTYIMDYAVVPEIESKIKNVLKKGVMGPLMGLGLALGFIFLLDFLDKTVRDEEDLKKAINFPVLECIPNIETEAEYMVDKSKIDPKLVTGQYTQSLVNEAYRSLRVKIGNHANVINSGTLVITSLNTDEGKSLTASNIAITFAQNKIPTLLVDADMRRGVIHNSFSINKRPGLSDILMGKNTLTEESVQSVIQKTHIPNLFVISSGRMVPNPTELLGFQRFKEFHSIIEKPFGVIIIDTPPLGIISDAAVISDIATKYLVVVRAAQTNVENLQKKILSFQKVKEKIAGVILNGVTLSKKHMQGSYSYYNY